ncbi:MAG TPA: hypothetical protein VH539_04925 [Gemmatimonadaceae bacterium]
MTSRLFRWCLGALFVAAALGGGACQNALDVNNPQLIPEGDLNDPQLVNVLQNTAIAALQTSYSEFVWYSAIMTDEALNATNDYRSGELSQRIVELAQGNAGPYNQLSRYRATSDSVASRIKALVPNPGTDLRLARALAYAGYGYVFLAEFLCTAPINGGPLITNDSMEVLALNRFSQAMTIATAGRSSSPLAADSIANFARVGAARASLNLGKLTEAITYASAVDTGFSIQADYLASANTSLQNSLWTRANGQNKQIGVHPLMQNLKDPRVRYVTKAVLGHNQLTLLNVPYSPRTFSTFTYVDSTLIAQNSKIEIASGLEARYVIAEASLGGGAGGWSTQQITDFVNERRAYGKETPYDPATDLFAALRDERRRDLYLGARRLGDLRRYKAQGVGDFFPSGQHPNKEWGLYGSATCYIITQDEMSVNPNVAGYVPPSTRPPGYSP